MSTLPQLRDSVVAAAERHAREGPTPAPVARTALRPRRWRRTLLISIAVVLVLAGVAFASGVIPFGTPAPVSPLQLFTAPTTGDGALTPGTVRMLPLSTPDPGRWSPMGHARVHDQPRPRVRRGRTAGPRQASRGRAGLRLRQRRPLPRARRRQRRDRLGRLVQRAGPLQPAVHQPDVGRAARQRLAEPLLRPRLSSRRPHTRRTGMPDA